MRKTRSLQARRWGLIPKPAGVKVRLQVQSLEAESQEFSAPQPPGAMESVSDTHLCDPHKAS